MSGARSEDPLSTVGEEGNDLRLNAKCSMVFQLLPLEAAKVARGSRKR